MQQILAGTNELHERVQNAEARATEAERQAQETQQELARSQAGVNVKEIGAAVPSQQEQGIGAFCVKVPASAVRVRGRQGARVFRSWSGRFFLVVRWQTFTNTLRDTATIQQPSWTWRSRH